MLWMKAKVAPVELQGDLSTFKPHMVLQIVDHAHASGELVFQTDENAAGIFFKSGRVQFASIKNRPIRLGVLLLNKGHISQEQLEEALSIQSAGKRLGKVLIENGFIDNATLRKVIQDQIKEVIYTIMGWNEGRFFFIKDRHPKNQDILIDTPIDSLMLEGIVRLDEQSRFA